MKFIFLIPLILITSSIYSGIKFGIDSNILKGFKYLDLYKYLANKILISHHEEAGQYIFKYKLTIYNFTITNITSPKDVIVINLNTSENYPLINVEFKDIPIDIQMKFYVEFGYFSESSEQLKIHTNLKSIKGEYYFLPNGEIKISKFNVELSDLNIDFQSKWINFLIGIFTNFIINQSEKYINSKNQEITNFINSWIDNEFLYDLGFGIGLNLTCIEKPILHRFTKEKKYNQKLYNLFFNKNKLNEKIETTILTLGLHGSIYPNLYPELKPLINDPINMTYITEYFDNELQILISDYSLNTLFFLAHQSGYLHMEFKNDLINIIPWNFSVFGLKEILPEYSKLYNKNYQVLMKGYVTVNNYPQPIIKISKEITKLNLIFGLDFYTFISDDPFDEPINDVKLNVSSCFDIHFIVQKGNLNIVIQNFNVNNVFVLIDNLNINITRFGNTIENAMNDYVLPSFDKYLKNIDIVNVLSEVLGTKMRNFRIGSQDGYIVTSIGVNGV